MALMLHNVVSPRSNLKQKSTVHTTIKLQKISFEGKYEKSVYDYCVNWVLLVSYGIVTFCYLLVTLYHSNVISSFEKIFCSTRSSIWTIVDSVLRCAELVRPCWLWKINEGDLGFPSLSSVFSIKYLWSMKYFIAFVSLRATYLFFLVLGKQIM